jgi:hypothetical protein
MSSYVLKSGTIESLHHPKDAEKRAKDFTEKKRGTRGKTVGWKEGAGRRLSEVV